MIKKENKNTKKIETDFLIIGSGIAGLTFALKVADFGKVVIITKTKDAESNTNYAQGGIVSVFDDNDSYENHIKDTLTAGADLNHRDAVELIVKEGPRLITELINRGIEFTKEKNGRLHLGREGGHSKSRIVHAKDHTGQIVETGLLEDIRNHKNITVYEDHIGIDLITEHRVIYPSFEMRRKVKCWGVYALDSNTGNILKIVSKITLLATGGAGQVYLHSTNPLIATGDGLAMAYRAGAKVGNMEFMQFHPTTLYHPESHSESQSFLISEAVRGAGAILISRDGEKFMNKYDKRGSLAPRDIVARAIDQELKSRGDSHVYLDTSKISSSKVKEHFPNIYQTCLKYKIDITKEPIPVVPAAHYICGGVVTDLEGKTTIEGLYACGEVSFTGVHGANRLASNSLLEALVFSDKAAKCALNDFKKDKSRIPDVPNWEKSETELTEQWILISYDKFVIKRLMWDYVGIVRTTLRLQRALNRIEVFIKEAEEYYRKAQITPEIIELRNLGQVAYLIVKSALIRKESRGLHYNSDNPERDDKNWLKDTIFSIWE